MIDTWKAQLDIKKVDLVHKIIPEIKVIMAIFANIHSVNLGGSNYFEISSYFCVKSDENALKLILLNLLENAIKYSGYPTNNEAVFSAECQCTVKVFEKNRNIVIEVEDYGIGIDAGDEEKIFTQAYHSESALRCHISAIKFIYVDLYYCQELARKMGGDLQLTHNKQPTIFKLILPKYKD
jgi:signal transduction histidine kinase